MTLTLNRPWLNICTAHRHIILDIYAKLFENPTRGSKDTEQTWNTVIQCLTLNFDLELTLVKHALHIDSSYLTFVQSYLKISTGVQKILSGHESVTDRQTDGRTENRAKNKMSPHFMVVDIINKKYPSPQQHN